VLDHARAQRWFAPGRENACNILDVVQPLWRCGRQTPQRVEEARADVAGVSDLLGYRPRGGHRPEPAVGRRRRPTAQ
jgi:hypothetical protein